MTDISKEDFAARLKKLIDNLWNIQSRIQELKEFESQWEDLCARLEEMTGTECRITLKNIAAYRCR